MIIGNIIKFGYGDIVVGHIFNHLTLDGIDQQFEPGSGVTEDQESTFKFITEPIDIEFTSFAAIKKFKTQLLKVNGESNKIIEMSGYTLDFSNYNAKSIDVIIHHLEKISL